ncbi:alpha/beta hydrolase [Pseudomonas entomophila]|uniref:alpha/beta fold hydrolase n=1 Tax=Pseudomonas entomophila TaxID=312306 RepID=UPI0023D84C2C|nr:alpha/beta hydrolase [Pseudomonas entomophila]MDF0729284.1 alpha/beta hydrolase [Pseudomonas entomophila]
MADSKRFSDLPQVRGERLEVRPGRHLSVAFQPGDQRADTVVFLGHGSGGNKDQWRELWRRLGEQGYSRVAWDLLGHGDSDKPHGTEHYAWTALVADQLALLERYAGPRNLVVAHSYGTGLTMSTLLEQPRRLPQVRIDGALLLGSLLHRPQRGGGLLKLPAWVLQIIRPLLARDFRDRAWHPVADRALVAYEEGVARRNRLDVFKSLMNNAGWPEAQALAGLTLPIEVVSGDRDGLTPATAGEALARQLPGGAFEVLGQCGHQLMLERPGEVWRAFERLVGRVG